MADFGSDDGVSDFDADLNQKGATTFWDQRLGSFRHREQNALLERVERSLKSFACDLINITFCVKVSGTCGTGLAQRTNHSVKLAGNPGV